MNREQDRAGRRFWRRAMLFSALFFFLAVWVVFDSLFQPLAPLGRTVEIPHFCGMHQDGITFADWMDPEISYRYDATAPAGVVLSQTPSGGSKRKLTKDFPQCKITLVVSLGTETCVLPDLTGEDGRVAEAKLREMGLSVEVRRVEGAYPVGTVFDSEPRAGETLPTDARVVLYVSAGVAHKSVSVPSLYGLSRSDALVQIWLCQLSVGEITEAISDAPAGTVIQQSHQAGTLVAGGTKISLVIAREANDTAAQD